MIKKTKLFYIFMAMVIILGGSGLAQNYANAGLADISVTYHDASGNNVSAVNTAINTTTVSFDPDGNINTGDGITVQFDNSDLSTAPVVNGDVTVTQAHTATDITKGTAIVGGIGLQNVLAIPITTESDTPSGAVTITIANSHITTPSSSGTQKITLGIWDLGADEAWGGTGADADTILDSSYAAVVIGTNQVNISGTVDPTLTLTLSGTTCALGTLSTTGLSTCSYDTEVSTNADSGYTAYIKADGNLRNATNSITNVADATVGVTNSGGVSTEEEYGISTTNASSTIVENDSGTDCATLDGQLTTAMPGSALSTSDQSFATATSPVSADSTTLCHAAVIMGTTPAGAYAQVVTVTVVGNF
ncbi:MAG: hypothetical protein WC460_05690 [Patescibacteria group bacterium]